MAAQPTTIGRYEVECQLGEGGMGAVYLAKDPTIGRRVAIKVLRTDDDEYRRRFKLEVNAAGALRHRHIITIFDSGEHAGAPFLAMEYVPGETLAQKIARREPPAITEKLRLVIELCDGLAHAHRAGIVHRDVKPANVIVDDDDGAVKIVDFGIARAASVTTTMTKSGMMVGTITYMAPEQILGKSVDRRADIFAVGCVLYELVAYRPAFPGGLEDGLMYRIVHEPAPSLGEVVPGLDTEVIAIVERALRKEPAERYQDIKEMSAALTVVRNRLLAQGAPAAVERAAPAIEPAPSPPTPQDTSSRGTRVIAALVLLALAVATAVVWYGGRPATDDAVSSTRDHDGRDASQGSAAAAAASAPAPASPSNATPSVPPTLTIASVTPEPPPGVSPALGKPETRLRVDAPSDAVLTLDGAVFTSNGLVAPGRHTLVSRRPGVIGAARQTIDVPEGTTPRVTADVSTGTIVGGKLPFPFASATVDGQPVSARTPALATALVAEFVPAAGSSMPARRVPFTLAAGAERELAGLLRLGGVRFQITPAADVTIDTRKFGTVTEGELLEAAEGDYPIRIRRSGYPDFTDTVRITGGLNGTYRFIYNFATGAWGRR